MAHSARLTTSSRTSFWKSSQVILSSRATISPTSWRTRCRPAFGAVLDEGKEDVLEGAVAELRLCAQLIQGTQPDDPPGGQQQQAIAYALGVGKLMDAEQ